MKPIVLIAALFALLSGCASSGVQVSQSAATQFKEGVSTEVDIISKLGKPTTTTIVSGKKILSYTGSQYQTKAASFIPIVGLFAGGSDIEVSIASYEFGEDGVLKRISYSSSGYNNRMGSTPADMQSREPTAVK